MMLLVYVIVLHVLLIVNQGRGLSCDSASTRTMARAMNPVARIGGAGGMGQAAAVAPAAGGG